MPADADVGGESSDADEDDGRSTVVLAVAAVVGVGVLLIVVIPLVVVLAAVLATFVLNLEDGTTGPAAEFSAEYDDGSLTIRHVGGQEIDPERLVLAVNGERRGTWADVGTAETVRPGDATTLAGVVATDRVTLTWQFDDSRSELLTWDGADAARLDRTPRRRANGALVRLRGESRTAAV